MRKLLAVTAIFSVFVYTSFAVKPTSKSKKNIDDEIATLKQSIVELQVKDSKNKAKDFLINAKNASSKGQTELAKAYESCSTACDKIAEGYKTNNQKAIDAGSKALFDATAAVKKCKQNLKTETDDYITKYQSIISDYKKSADDYSEKAKQAQKAGKSDLLIIYSTCADAKNKIAGGLTKVLDGKEQYGKAVKVYNEFVAAQDKLNIPEKQIPNKGAQQLDKMASNLVNDAQTYSERADQEYKNNNVQLALACVEIAGAKRLEAAGLSAISDGKNAFERASAKLKK
jgi:hypothetical protein